MIATPQTSDPQSSSDQSLPPLGFSDHAVATQEMFSAWTCTWIAWSVWRDYLARLATASNSMMVLDAGAQLMTDSMEIGNRAAAVGLRAGGVYSPLLNDA